VPRPWNEEATIVIIEPYGDDQRAVDEIARRGPTGAFALAGAALAIVVAIWVAFYVSVFLPRG
jgi:hypothetical protein